MWTIEKRCARRGTSAFVARDTVDVLGAKLIGIVGDRRMTKMHRYVYLGNRVNTPTLCAGLRVWPGGFSGPTTVRAGESASIALASQHRSFEGLYISTSGDNETEEQVRERYDHSEKQWLGQRRNITLVDLDGWPGEPGRDDSIRIEYWNDHGVGQETIVVFDDVDPIQELAWDLKGDRERRVHMDDEWCATHDTHAEDPEHEHRYGVCSFRPATVAENLAVLAIFGRPVR